MRDDDVSAMEIERNRHNSRDLGFLPDNTPNELVSLFDEWLSPEDEEAFRDL